MSLRMAMLSLIAAEPRSGYDITKDFAGLLTFVWHAKPAQIYPELKKLEAEGLLEQVASGPRGRRLYGITERGIDEIREWLVASPVDHSQRSEPLLRTFSLWLVSRDDALDFLRAEAEFSRLRVKGMRRIASRLSTDVPIQRAWLLGVEAGIRRLQAQVEWAEWAQEQVASWPATPTLPPEAGVAPPEVLGDLGIE